MKYFFNPESSECVWEVPLELAEFVDASGAFRPPVPVVTAVQLAEGRADAEKQNQWKSDFTKMVQELKIPRSHTYDKALPSLIHDKRFLAVPKDERPALFKAAMRQVLESASAATAKAKKQNIDSLEKFLDEMEAAGRLKIPMAVDDCEERFGDDLRWKQHPAPVRRAVAAKRIELMTTIKRNHAAEFLKLIREELQRAGSSLPSWSSVKEKLRSDERFTRLPLEERENIFQKEVNVIERERKALASAQRREATLQSATKEKVQRGEARTLFRNQLAERLKTPFGLSFREALQELPRIPAGTPQLSETAKREEFEDFLRSLAEERLPQFLACLRISKCIHPGMTFDEAVGAAQLRDDRRFLGLGRCDLINQYDVWKEEKIEELTTNFANHLKTKSLLKKKTFGETESEVEEIMKELAGTERFEMLSSVPEIRKDVVFKRIREEQNDQQTSRKRRTVGTGDEDANSTRFCEDDIDYLQMADVGDD
eukprot:Polyplicarium_translucidae@DN465_c0_g1_i1.p1